MKQDTIRTRVRKPKSNGTGGSSSGAPTKMSNISKNQEQQQNHNNNTIIPISGNLPVPGMTGLQHQNQSTIGSPISVSNNQFPLPPTTKNPNISTKVGL
jgi:hypothetical protein